MVKKIVFGLAMLFLSVALMGVVSARYINFCLADGETIDLCGVSPDFTCSSTLCTFCVNEISNGVYCQALPQHCEGACVPFTDDGGDDPDEDLPDVELQEPLNWKNFPKDDNEVRFKYKLPEYRDISSCELILDGVSVYSDDDVSRYNTFTYIVEEGDHKWRVDCVTDDGVDITSDERNLVILSDVMLVSPDDGFSATGAQNVEFGFEFAENIEVEDLTQCNLVLDGAATDVVIVVLSDDETNKIIKTMTPGTYSWGINCKDADENEFTSQSRSLIISSPPPPPNNGGGPSGGSTPSGGGSSTTKKTEEKKADIVKEDEDLETLGNEVVDQSGLEENLEENLDESGSGGITGAAIGTILQKNVIPIIIFLMVVVAIGIVIYSRKKN